MNTISKIAFSFGILSVGILSAQTNPEVEKFDSPNMRNMIKVGANVGIAVPQGNASAAAGVDVAYQHLVTPGFGIGVATGYTHFFGRDNDVNVGGVTTRLNNNDFGVVPVAAMFRFYPKDLGFYIGTDLGYGFIVGDDQVASNHSTLMRPDGGFYIKPEIGYHNRDWNFAIQYQKVFTDGKGDYGNQDYNAGALGLGVSYNIPLGK